jgi:hypothetical protein
MYYNLICIFICTPICTKSYSCKKWVLHPTSRSPGHRVANLCDHPRSSAPGLLLLPRSSSLHVMPHLPPAHHETSKHDSPNETKIKEKQNETIPDSNSNLTKSMTHHNQTKEQTTWFLTYYDLQITHSEVMSQVSRQAKIPIHQRDSRVGSLSEFVEFR